MSYRREYYTPLQSYDYDNPKRVKVSGNRTNYEPLELTDEAVEDLARHYYSMEEIAARFSVHMDFIREKHLEAFHRGKDNVFKKSRMMLDRVVENFKTASEEDKVFFARKETPTHNLMSALELQEKYHGKGIKSEVVSTNTNINATPASIEFIIVTGRDDPAIQALESELNKQLKMLSGDSIQQSIEKEGGSE